MFSVEGPKGVWTFPIRGPKPPRQQPQGLPWVSSLARRARPEGPGEHSPGFTLGNSPPPELSPEGAIRYGVRIPSPFRAKRLYRLTQGKPWAKLSCPFGAGSRGRMTGAKQMQGGTSYLRSDGTSTYLR